MITLDPVALEELRIARHILENPSFAARVADVVGRPIEKSIQMLPPGWRDNVAKASRLALEKAFELAISTLDRDGAAGKGSRWHRLMAALSGAGGGALGLPGLVLELPVSTCLMLRSVAEIARRHGHDIASPLVRMECLEVFALGGPSSKDDATEGGYWAMRAALGKAVSDAAGYLAGAAGAGRGAPVVVRLLETIAKRFGVVVSQQVAAKAVPVVGALGGAAVNWLFTDHFQHMAEGHFTIRRLEKQFGTEAVRIAYEACGQPSPASC